MQRVVSLYLPTWSTDRYRRALGKQAPPVDRPVVMIARQGSRRVIAAQDVAASALGLRLGMPVSKAQAIIPGLIVEELQTADDAKALRDLAFWFLRIYAPIVAPDPPAGLVLDTTGADHLHGNELLMLSGMINRMHGLGFTARAAIADSWGAAHALARFGKEPLTIVPRNGLATALGPLPLAALRLEPRILSDLKVLGFHTIADLMATARAPLTLRFGPEIGRRLDQAHGLLSEPIEPIRIPELVETFRFFAEPISAAETIARYTEKLVRQLCLRLEKRGLGARRVDLVLHRVDSGIQAIRAGTSRPVRDVKQLSRLLTDRIDTINPGFGIEKMILTASHAEALVPGQARSTLLDESKADIGETVDVLINRGHKVYRYSAVASDVPERSVQMVAAHSADDTLGWPDHWPRPVRLLSRPEPIQTMALLPDHPPKSFTWRGIRRLVKRADGPERVFGEWWKRDREQAAVRDYFTVEDESGERFWIFRSGDGEHANTGSQGWFLHGIFG
ncbi:Y-family DNA polymerase [Rhizobium skierniewicense]|uniref:Y-family DNA polymerase n=1 Tax=Rhizobium skierniewicense TaxID=984260 RepID=UPI001572187B|nr:DNA polymerase Y family protein [Rhizobium skierniewicense]NTF33751.1 DNA polymerase Y family protein [Rhizobium skierniewicense]